MPDRHDPLVVVTALPGDHEPVRIDQLFVRQDEDRALFGRGFHAHDQRHILARQGIGVLEKLKNTVRLEEMLLKTVGRDLPGGHHLFHLYLGLRLFRPRAVVVVVDDVERYVELARVRILVHRRFLRAEIAVPKIPKVRIIGRPPARNGHQRTDDGRKPDGVFQKLRPDSRGERVPPDEQAVLRHGHPAGEQDRQNQYSFFHVRSVIACFGAYSESKP